MSETRFIDILKRQESHDKANEDTLFRILSKIENHKRLSTDEFERVYELLHKDGPPIKYQNIAVTTRVIHQTRNTQSGLQNF